MHSASGPVDFPAIVLKRCKATLAAPLYQLWRSSLDSGIIPQYLVSQKIVPVFKKGSKTEAQNYRPVSLTSHVIKIFERVMRKFLVHWLEANNLLSKHQHGFRKSKSCVTQLLAHIDSILNMLMEGANADVIYLDFLRNWKTLVSGERFLHGQSPSYQIDSNPSLLKANCPLLI